MPFEKQSRGEHLVLVLSAYLFVFTLLFSRYRNPAEPSKAKLSVADEVRIEIFLVLAAFCHLVALFLT
jgi:protein involved in polysaccharide export with SLBB domain